MDVGMSLEQLTHRRDVTGFATSTRLVQWRAQIFGDTAIDGSLCGQQETTNVVVALVRRESQRRPSSLTTEGWIGSRFKQAFDCLDVPVIRSDEKRSLFPLIASVDVRSPLKQQVEDLETPLR